MEAWYSSKPRSRFSREHRDMLPFDAKMIDTDQVLWVPYEGIGGAPLLIAELKPEHAAEDFWIVTRALARLAGLPAAKIIERQDGRYNIYVASERTNWEPHHVGDGLTIHDWYALVEEPLRQRRRNLAAAA